MRTSTAAATRALAEEEFVQIELVNDLRNRVRKLSFDGYPGTSPVTKELLANWWSPERERRLFFCQLEAAETIIFLLETPAHLRQGLAIPGDQPNDSDSLTRGYKGLLRYACKMATGSGKTIVMAMLIAWSVINKSLNRHDGRFSHAVVLVRPTLTIK